MVLLSMTILINEAILSSVVLCSLQIRQIMNVTAKILTQDDNVGKDPFLGEHAKVRQ